MIKTYRTLKDRALSPPYDKKGLKLRMDEKKAQSFVTKGDIEELGKKPQTKKQPVKKAVKTEKKDVE